MVPAAGPLFVEALGRVPSQLAWASQAPRQLLSLANSQASCQTSQTLQSLHTSTDGHLRKSPRAADRQKRDPFDPQQTGFSSTLPSACTPLPAQQHPPFVANLERTHALLGCFRRFQRSRYAERRVRKVASIPIPSVLIALDCAIATHSDIAMTRIAIPAFRLQP